MSDSQELFRIWVVFLYLGANYNNFSFRRTVCYTRFKDLRLAPDFIFVMPNVFMIVKQIWLTMLATICSRISLCLDVGNHLVQRKTHLTIKKKLLLQSVVISSMFSWSIKSSSIMWIGDWIITFINGLFKSHIKWNLCSDILILCLPMNF